MKSFLAAGLALVACVACAATNETFNSMLVSGTPITTGDWAGGIVEEKTTGSEDHVLAIDGKVSCSNATEAVSSEFVKTSFKVKAPCEGTTDFPEPGSDELANCQIAVATGEATSNGEKVKVMVYSGASSPTWADSGITVPTGELFTVSLRFNYMTTNVTVAINDAFATNTYDLVTPPANSATVAKINSLSFVGLSKIDDVNIAEAYSKSHLADSLDGLEIYPEDIAPVTDANIAANGGNANAIKSVAAGLTPTTGDVNFYATSLATVTESETLKTVVTVPCKKDFGQVYNIVVDDGTQKTRVGVSEVEVGAIESDSRALKFVMPANNNVKVLKFHVEVGGPDGATNNS